MIDLVKKFSDIVRQDYRDHGLRGLRVTAERTESWLIGNILDETVYRFARRNAQNVYEREWDVLILLDCARIDMMEAVRDEYDFIREVGEHVSPGTTSPEWMKYTFTDEYEDEMSETLHVTANTSSHRVLDASDFLHLEEVWRDGWDDEYKTILPQTVTDRAIAYHRELHPRRTILHYMQPHLPFIPFPDVAASEISGPGVGRNRGKTVPELAEDGYSREELWEFHMENLRCALDSVEVLLSNIDADRVVISSDHGQALGENGEWGHPRGSSLDCLRRVPWCVTSASDSGTYDPEYEIGKEEGEDDLSVEDKLRYLGYKPD